MFANACKIAIRLRSLPAFPRFPTFPGSTVTRFSRGGTAGGLGWSNFFWPVDVIRPVLHAKAARRVRATFMAIGETER